MRLSYTKQHSGQNSTIVVLPFDSIKTKKVSLDIGAISNNLSSHDLLPAITHELKTPISAIISFAENLRDDLCDPKKLNGCKNSVAEIIAVANEMNELVHDLLDVSQIYSGNFSVDSAQKINISDPIKRAVRINKDYAMRRNILLKTEISPEAETLANLDSKRMKQILTNLISNAIKYSKPQTEIKISAKVENKFLEISVLDQGFGMTSNQLKIAFEKYRTIQNENSNKVDSFGLGLPIVKQLVELQNGIIEAHSEVGKGTEIKLKFPHLM